MVDILNTLLSALSDSWAVVCGALIASVLLAPIGEDGIYIVDDDAGENTRNRRGSWLSGTLILTLSCISPYTHSTGNTHSSIQIYNHAIQCFNEHRINNAWKQAAQCANDSHFYGNKIWPDDAAKKAQALHRLGYSLMMAEGRSNNEGLQYLQQSYELSTQSGEHGHAALIPLLLDITLAKILAGVDAQDEIALILNTVAKEKGERSQAYAATALGLAHALGQQRSGNTDNQLDQAIALIDKSEPAMVFLGDGIRHFISGKIALNAGDTQSAKKHLYQAANHESLARQSLMALVKLHDAEHDTDASALCATRLAMIMPKREPQHLKPLFALKAEYPYRAKQDNISGYALVSLTVTPEGRVIDPVIVGENPRNKGFAQSTLKTATKLRYAPRINDNGMPVATHGVIYKHYFQAPQS